MGLAQHTQGDPNCTCRGGGCTKCLAAHPEGKTCRDCVWFKPKCSWLLSYSGDETECDWIPSKFHENKGDRPQ